MQKFRRWLHSLFGFTTSQTHGFLVLLPLLTVALFSEPAWRFYSRYHRAPEPGAAVLEAFIAGWQEEAPVLSPGSRLRTQEASVAERFLFNPNHTGFDSLRRLGITAHLARRIIHYRDKGGRFHAKRDLLKIYGFDSLLYQTLAPLIQLPDKAIRENYFSGAHAERKAAVTFDLNTADTAQLKRIYGIGNALSLRIVKFRDGLGGFISGRQVYEVYGLDSTVVKRLLEVSYIADGFRPRRFNVNTIDERTLSAHPYIPGSIAKAIVAYRFQHGEFRAIDDLRNIPIVTEAIIKKIEPYILFSE